MEGQAQHVERGGGCERAGVLSAGVRARFHMLEQLRQNMFEVCKWGGRSAVLGAGARAMCSVQCRWQSKKLHMIVGTNLRACEGCSAKWCWMPASKQVFQMLGAGTWVCWSKPLSVHFGSAG